MPLHRPATRADRGPDVTALAAAARSIVSCPAEVGLTVAGVADVQTGELLAMADTDGSPTFTCRPGSLLSLAAARERHALVRLASGLVPGDRLALGGRLVLLAREDCPCCEEERDVVALRLHEVTLTRVGRQARQVPLEAFGAAEHRLNRGYLQRCTDHANHAHQDQLRSAISTTMTTRYADVLGVQLDDLTAAGVGLTWIDTRGAHRQRLDFSHTAGDAADLALLLREELHTGLC